jgi:hypothetical protein
MWQGAITSRECGRSAHRGVVAAGSPTGETWCNLAYIHLGSMAYMPLHGKLDGMAGKGMLTGEEVGAAEVDGIEGENRRVGGGTLHSLVP